MGASWERLGAFRGVLGRLGRRLVSMWANKQLLGLQMAQNSSLNHPTSTHKDNKLTIKPTNNDMITVQKILITYVKRTFSNCITSFIRPFKRLRINEIENMCLSVLRGVGGIRRSL